MRLLLKLRSASAGCPAWLNVHVHQVIAAPALRVNVDRTRAVQVGITQRDVANSLLASLASSSDQAPNFWLNPQNGVSYRVAVQTPQYRIDSIDALQREPIAPAGANATQLLQTWPVLSAAPPPRWPTTTTYSRSTMCLQACRTAIWAEPAGDIKRTP